MLVVIGEIRKRISLRRRPDGHLQSMKSELPRLGHEPIQPQPSRRSLRFLQGKRPFKPFTYTRYIGNCVVFKVREEANSPHGCPRTETRWPPAVKPVSQNSTACGDKFASELPLGEIGDFSRLRSRVSYCLGRKLVFSRCHPALPDDTGSVDISSGRSHSRSASRNSRDVRRKASIPSSNDDPPGDRCPPVEEGSLERR